MDLLVAIAVWAVGAWLAYRWGVRGSAIPGRGASGPDEEPRRRQEGMDVRRRRGQH